jgi:hypothetical protein
MNVHRRIARRVVVTALLGAQAACGEPRAATDPGGLASSAPPAPPAPPPAGTSVRDELERARACSADAECVHLGDFCHAGCSVTVNREHRDAVLSLLSSPRGKCFMDCPPVDPPICRKGRCESPSR